MTATAVLLLLWVDDGGVGGAAMVVCWCGWPGVVGDAAQLVVAAAVVVVVFAVAWVLLVLVTLR